MDKNLDIITYAVSLIIKAAIIAARFSGRVRKRSLKRSHSWTFQRAYTAYSAIPQRSYFALTSAYATNV